MTWSGLNHNEREEVKRAIFLITDLLSDNDIDLKIGAIAIASILKSLAVTTGIEIQIEEMKPEEMQ